MQSIYFGSCSDKDPGDVVINKAAMVLSYKWSQSLWSKSSCHDALSCSVWGQDVHDTHPSLKSFLGRTPKAHHLSQHEKEKKEIEEVSWLCYYPLTHDQKGKDPLSQVKLHPGSSCQHNPGTFRRAETAQNLQVWPERNPWGSMFLPLRLRKVSLYTGCFQGPVRVFIESQN